MKPKMFNWIPRKFPEHLVEKQFQIEIRHSGIKYLGFSGYALIFGCGFFFFYKMFSGEGYSNLSQFLRLGMAAFGMALVLIAGRNAPLNKTQFLTYSLAPGFIAYFAALAIVGTGEIERFQAERLTTFSILIIILTASVHRVPLRLNCIYVILIAGLWVFRGSLTAKPMSFLYPNFIYILIASVASLAIAIATENRERSLFWQRLEAQRARDAADAANRSKSYLLAAASHDLRQPLTAMALWSERLQTPKSLPQVSTIAAEMRQSVDTLRSMLDALLDLSKLDAGAVPLRIQSVSVQAVLQEIYREYLDRANAAKLSLVLDCSADLWISSDPVHLLRIVRNLVHNAILYTEGGSVTLSAQALAGGQVEIAVTDTGAGIAAEDLGLVFDEYFQVNNPNRDRSKGLGLGLSIVKRLVDMMEHRLVLESAVGKGSRFALIGSLTKPEQDRKFSLDSYGPKRLDGLQVLLIEDDPMVREALGWSLKDLGADVRFAVNLHQARLAAKQGCALVVADYRLGPDHSGLEILEILSSEFELLTGLVLTGEADIQAIGPLANAPYPVLSKPPSLEELASVLLAMQAEQVAD
jgi:signal transduction histidine kinase/CheY-like chemotaxis protein